MPSKRIRSTLPPAVKGGGQPVDVECWTDNFELEIAVEDSSAGQDDDATYEIEAEYEELNQGHSESVQFGFNGFVDSNLGQGENKSDSLRRFATATRNGGTNPSNSLGTEDGTTAEVKAGGVLFGQETMDVRIVPPLEGAGDTPTAKAFYSVTAGLLDGAAAGAYYYQPTTVGGDVPITFIGATFNAGTTNAETAVTMSNEIVAGDFLLGTARTTNATVGVHATPSGWTLLERVGDGTNRSSLYYKIASGADAGASVEFFGTGLTDKGVAGVTANEASVSVYRGVDQTTPYELFNATELTIDGTHTLPNPIKETHADETGNYPLTADNVSQFAPSDYSGFGNKITFSDNEYLYRPNGHTEFNLGNWSNWTIEGRIGAIPQTSGATTDDQWFIGVWDNATNERRHWVIGFDASANANSGGFGIIFKDGLGVTKSVYSSNDFDDNQEHTWAITYDGAVIRVFVDGVQEGTLAHISGFYSGSATELFIGNLKGLLNLSALAGLDEIRVSSTARYSALGYTPATSPFTVDADTVALWHLDSATGDYGTNEAVIYAAIYGGSNPASGNPTSATFSTGVQARVAHAASGGSQQLAATLSGSERVANAEAAPNRSVTFNDIGGVASRTNSLLAGVRLKPAVADGSPALNLQDMPSSGNYLTTPFSFMVPDVDTTQEIFFRFIHTALLPLLGGNVVVDAVSLDSEDVL